MRRNAVLLSAVAVACLAGIASFAQVQGGNVRAEDVNR